MQFSLQHLLPALGLLLCIALLLRMVLPAAWRLQLKLWWLQLRQRRRGPSKAEAKRAADEAIRRARGEWDGNVYRPDEFKRPRKPH